MSVRFKDETVLMIKKINAVGISKLRSYVKKSHPKENFDRNIAIVRDHFKSGAEYCCKKYGVEYDAPCRIILRYYRYAVEIERNEQT